MYYFDKLSNYVRILTFSMCFKMNKKLVDMNHLNNAGSNCETFLTVMQVIFPYEYIYIYIYICIYIYRGLGTYPAVYYYPSHTTFIYYLK